MWLVLVFPHTKSPISKSFMLFSIVVTIFVSFAAQTNLIFRDVVFQGKNITSVPGIGMPLFFVHTVFFLGGGVLKLIRKFKKSSGVTRVQIQLFLLGTAVMYISTFITNYLVILIFNTSFFIVFLPIYALIFVGAISYAIVKHKFLDISLVVARTVSYTLLLILFGFLYALLLGSFTSIFVDEAVSTKSVIISAILALLMAFTFPQIRRWLEKLTDKIFYKEKYDTDEVLAKLSKIMASTIRLDDLTHGMLEVLLEELRIGEGALILLENDLVADVKSEGFKTPPVLDENEVKLLAQTRDMIIFEELEEGNIKDFLRKYNLTTVAHLRTEGKQVGLLALGSKSSGDIYSQQDLNLLDILTPEAAVALQNARAYEEIRRFNITLQDEVNRATADLQTANVKLQELDKLKDEFVSLASHELRTPMTAIKGSLSTILEGFAGEVSPQSKEFLTAAYNENDRLIRLINNLLNISRIEAGRFTFTVVKTDMDQLISEVVHNLEMAGNEKNLFLKYEKVEELPPVYADIDKVKEVLVNLVGNAIKFTHKGGITIRAIHKDNQVITSVTDTGSGIAKEDQELLFKKFSQVGSYTKQGGGTGLGLYISKQIIEGLKGQVWLESTLGTGSTFFFSLPIVT
jgi:signal transduction histidine kinase